MKILELCLSRGGLGGLELYFVGALDNLSRAGHQCIGIVRPGTHLTNKLKESQHNIFYLDPRSRYLPFRTARELARIVDDNEIDIIHMHWAKDLAVAVWGKRFSKRGPKLVYTRHMAILGSKHNPYHKMMYREIDLLLTITEKMRGQAVRNLPLDPEKIKTLYLGVNLDKKTDDVCAHLRKELSIGESHYLIGLVGRIEPAKGQQILVEAIRKLRSRNIAIHAIIVGTAKKPENIAKLEQKIDELDVANYVHLIGFHNNPVAVMNCMDICVLTTFHETFGLVLIEAMSVGVPVIGTNYGGVPEIIDDEKNGYLVHPGNSDELADKIYLLLHDAEKRKSFGKAARKKVEQFFNISDHYIALDNSFRSLLHTS